MPAVKASYRRLDLEPAPLGHLAEADQHAEVLARPCHEAGLAPLSDLASAGAALWSGLASALFPRLKPHSKPICSDGTEALAYANCGAPYAPGQLSFVDPIAEHPALYRSGRSLSRPSSTAPTVSLHIFHRCSKGDVTSLLRDSNALLTKPARLHGITGQLLAGLGAP